MHSVLFTATLLVLILGFMVILFLRFASRRMKDGDALALTWTGRREKIPFAKGEADRKSRRGTAVPLNRDDVPASDEPGVQHG